MVRSRLVEKPLIRDPSTWSESPGYRSINMVGIAWLELHQLGLHFTRGVGLRPWSSNPLIKTLGFCLDGVGFPTLSKYTHKKPLSLSSGTACHQTHES